MSGSGTGLLVALSVWGLELIFNDYFLIFERVVALPLLSIFGLSLFYQLNKRSNSGSLHPFITKKIVKSASIVQFEQNIVTSATSTLMGQKIAEAAQKLTQEGITYKNIHYKTIEQTLSSKTLDCSSFVRRAIYTTTQIDIGNIKSDRFATSSLFATFTQSSKALPGDIVQVRGHVAICLDKECTIVGEAASFTLGLLIRSISNSAIASSKLPITYYRFKPVLNAIEK